jgi:uncharacterized protein YndB with AHSA1/START domain
MSLVDNTPAEQTDSISFELDLAHSPSKVWRAITDPALLKEWLLPATGLELTLGNEFTFNTEPHPGWDGTVRCRMLEIEEKRTLRYSWSVGDMELDTVVTFSLTPIDTGTRLSLVQSGFKPHQKQNWGGARYGWKMMGGKLIDLLERTRTDPQP